MSEQAVDQRPIVAYVRRDDISWWAGCQYTPKRAFETRIAEESCLTQWGAERKARRMAKKARKLRDRNQLGQYTVGAPR